MGIEDLHDKTFGRLRVVKFEGTNSYRQAKWLAYCDPELDGCGGYKITTGTLLTSNQTKSCGCLKRESLSKIATKHSQSNHPVYRVWQNIKTRCYNPKRRSYKDYGARGITVCEEWLNSPESFVQWALENGWEPGLTIERRDVNGNYEPNNCLWIPAKEQYRNRTDTHWVIHEEKKISLIEYVEKVGKVPILVVRDRLHKGWSLEKAVLTPLTRKPKKSEYFKYWQRN